LLFIKNYYIIYIEDKKRGKYMDFYNIIFDFYPISEICEIVEHHPISWTHIAEAVREAIPLIENCGPDILYLTIKKEKERRHLNE
jgi:hypothetical protein